MSDKNKSENISISNTGNSTNTRRHSEPHLDVDNSEPHPTIILNR